MPVIQLCTVSPAEAGLATIQTIISSATIAPRTFCNNGSRLQTLLSWRIARAAVGCQCHFHSYPGLSEI
jgi:hypothetical protein